MDHSKQLRDKQEQGLVVFTQKNTDYGDSFAVFGVVGVIVRMQDKITRIINLLTCSGPWSPAPVIDGESVMDTSVDLFNYSTMAIMLLQEGDITGIATKKTITGRVLQMKQVHQQGLAHYQANSAALNAKLIECSVLQEFKLLSQKITESMNLTHNSIAIYNLPDIQLVLFDIHVFSGLVEILHERWYPRN